GFAEDDSESETLPSVGAARARRSPRSSRAGAGEEASEEASTRRANERCDRHTVCVWFLVVCRGLVTLCVGLLGGGRAGGRARERTAFFQLQQVVVLAMPCSELDVPSVLNLAASRASTSGAGMAGGGSTVVSLLMERMACPLRLWREAAGGVTEC